MAKATKTTKTTKTKTTKSDVSSRITRTAKTQTKPVANQTKEEAAEELATLVLEASEKAKCNIQKSAKNKCVVVEFTGMATDKITCLVFKSTGITVLVEHDPTTALFNSLKRTYDSIPNAAKFIRCAFIKDKVDLALRVPMKLSIRAGKGSSTDMGA